MSWFSKAKAAAASAAKATSKAASAAAAMTSAVIDDLKAPPTTVTCSGCQATLAVPAEVFTWLCQTPSCLASGLSYPLSTKECSECKQPQPEQPPPEVACGVCNAHTLVPTSKAAAHLSAAKDTTVKMAEKTADYTAKTFDSLRSMPTEVKCIRCSAPLQVPPTAFDWTCPTDKTTMASPELKEGQTRRLLPPSKCTTCKAPAPVESPVVICASCGVETSVPRSNASKHLSTAVKVTKETAVKTKVFVKAQYKEMAAAPSEFNCEHCNTVLRVEGVNPDDFEGDVMLTCGACQRATSVPKNNFMNFFRNGVASTSRSVGKVYYVVSKTPHVMCPTCGSSVSIKVIEDEKAPVDEEEDVPKREPITCPKCQTEIQPVAQPAQVELFPLSPGDKVSSD